MPFSSSDNRRLVSRIMYLLCAAAWGLLLWPIPYTVIMASCFACLIVPFYKRLRTFARRHRRQMESKRNSLLLAAREKHKDSGKQPRFGKRSLLPFTTRFVLGFRQGLYNMLPMTATILTLLFAITIPVTTFVSMVTPQIASGIALLRRMWMDNFKLPDELASKLDVIVEKMQAIPGLDTVAHQVAGYQETLYNYLSTFSSDSLVALANQGFDLLGGASSVAGHMVLFLALSVVFIIHAPRIRLTASRIFNVKPLVLHRFSVAIRQALRAILLGVVLVAIIQGFLCAIGFAIVGINQYAFCGLLAAIVAPIPVLGTAIVWVPLSVHLWLIDRPMAAVTLIIWGVGIVSMADSVLRPFFLRTGINASFVVLILVIFCGISAFGSAGIILGPVLLAISIQALEEGNVAYPSLFKPMAVEKTPMQAEGKREA